jgi:hypothetical protein
MLDDALLRLHDRMVERYAEDEAPEVEDDVSVPQFLNVSAMQRLMNQERYGVRAGMKHGSRVQYAEPQNADGSCRPGPVYVWSSGQNGWVFERHQFCSC